MKRRRKGWAVWLGVSPDTGFGPSVASSGLDSPWAEAAAPEDSRFMTRQAMRLVASNDTAQRRVFSTYLAARTVLGMALFAAQAAVVWLGTRESTLLLMVCGAYALQATLFWAWPQRRDGAPGDVGPRSWWGSVGVDVLAFGAMHWLEPSASLNHAALLVLPVLMAGVLSAPVTALATTSVVAMLLLATAWRRSLAGGELTSLMSQAGLAGMGLYVIALVAGQLATRLAREERTARGSLELARQQAELNRLVIDEMADGVLVVDQQGRVRAANPAARELLAEGGQCPPPPFTMHGQAGWAALLAAVQEGFGSGHWPEAGRDLTLAYAGTAPRSVRVRARFTRGAQLPVPGQGGGKNEVLAVLFVEELRKLLARQRQERLVAMGRISAGIAHEIRNPLAAVSQANALLQEDALRPDQQRLVRIVADNVERLRRIVDDVMEVAPGVSTPSRIIDATAEVAAICAEWARTNGVVLGQQSRLHVQLPAEALGAVFDVEHLRRVLVNLLDNAWRHAGERAGAVRVTLDPISLALVRLAVASDGEPIAPEVEAHLFEPFHSSRSRGTGLGLYICRQLCERHGASIDYLRRPDERHGNVFQVVMRRDQVAAEGRLHL